MNLRGRWVKLYCEGSPKWRAMPVLARGLGYALLIECDELGRIDCGAETHADVLVRLLGAHVDERRAVRAAFARLLADGFVKVDGSFLVIVNFIAAQTTRSPEAERKAKQRERERVGSEGRTLVVTPPEPPLKGTPEGLANPPSKVDGQSDLSTHNSSHEVRDSHGDKRREEKRREELARDAGAHAREGDPGGRPSAIGSFGGLGEPEAPSTLEILGTIQRTAGASLQSQASSAVQLAFGRVVRECGYTEAQLLALGGYLLALFDGVEKATWSYDRKAFTLSRLLGKDEKGAMLSSLVAEAEAFARKTAPPTAMRGAEAGSYAERRIAEKAALVPATSRQLPSFMHRKGTG